MSHLRSLPSPTSVAATAGDVVVIGVVGVGLIGRVLLIGVASGAKSD
jgi:hypothetical protein